MFALLLISLFVLEFPLAAMPAAASHARSAVTDADVLAADDDGCTAANPGICTVQILIGGVPYIGFRRDMDTSDPSDWKPVNTRVIRAHQANIALSSIAIETRFGTGDQGTNAGACRPDLTATETTRRDIEWFHDQVVASSRTGTNTNTNVASAASDVKIVAVAEGSLANGYRTLPIRVWNKVMCVAGTGSASSADLDKSWNITLKDVPIDNTLPDYSVVIEPVGGSGIAKLGDPIHFEMVVNDGDFRNFETICGQYVVSMALDSMTNPDPGFFNKATNRLDITEFFTPDTDPKCLDELDVTGDTQGKNLTVSAAGVAPSELYDYDNVPWAVGKARLGGAGKGITSTSTLPTFLPSFDVTVTDEALNPKVLALSGGSLPRVDAVRPDPIDANPANAVDDPVVPTQIVNGARLTWPGATLSYDVVGVKVEWRKVGTGPWLDLTHQVTNSIVARTALANSYSFDAKPQLTEPTNVEFRLTTVDDAGNLGVPSVTTAININPVDTPVAEVLRSDGLGLVGGTFHPFDSFLIEAAGGSGIPETACPGSTCPVKFVMTRPGTAGAFWNNQQGTFVTTQVLNEVTRISTSPARFMFTFNPCVARESSCLERRTYEVRAVVTDSAGRVGESTPIPLVADTKTPDFPGTTNTNKINLPVAGKNEVMQGAYVDVSLKATDAISGLREVRFAFVPSQTSHQADALTTVFDRRAVACMAYPETRSPYTSESTPIAYARIPAEDSPTCPPIFPPEQTPVPERLQFTEYFRCPTSTNPCTHFETGVKSLDRSDLARMSQCTTLGAPTTHEVCYNATTPRVRLSTEGVPFGTWYVNVELVDWAGRKKDLTLGDAITIVPRVALPGEVADLTDPSITRVNRRYDNGKINLTVYAAYTDDVDAVGGACGATTVSTTTIPSRTATCTPTSVTIDYLPAAQTDQEANYRVIKSFSVPARLTPEVPAYSADSEFERFELVPGEGGPRFFRYDLKEFQLPANSPAPSQTSSGNTAVRVVVKAKTTVGSNIVEKTVKVPVELTGKPVPTAIQFLSPYTTWAADRQPTFYRAESTTDAQRGAGKSDIDLKVAFQKANLPTANTAVYFRIYDRNLTYIHQIRATHTTFIEPQSLYATHNVHCPVNDQACVKGAAYYYRMTSVWTKANALDWESPQSDLATVLVNRTYLVKDGNPAVAGDQPITASVDAFVPPGAPDLAASGTFNHANGKATLTWSPPNASTLTSALSASATSIPVADLAKFPDTGTVQIGNERIRYAGRSATSGAGTLTVTTRGADGTGAQSNAANTAVQLLPIGLPAGYTLSAYRLYRGHVFDLTENAKTLPRATRDYACDTARPSNLSNPCRLVYWANGTADKSGKPEFSAAVNIHRAGGIEAVNNPDDPDHVMAHTRHNASAFPNSASKHVQGLLPWKAYEVNLTRGQYILEVSAHSPKPATTPNFRSVFTSQRAIAQLTELGHVARAFQVETRVPSIRVEEGAGDFRPFGGGVTHWTDSTLSVNVCVDPKNFVKTDRKNVTAGLILGESSTGSGLTWVPGVTYSARKIDPNSTKEFPTPLAGAPSASLVVTGSAVLTGDLSAAAATIPVSNLAAFPTSGAVRIGDERIWFSARSGVSGAGTLTVEKRGADGTSIEAHPQGTTVANLLGSETTTIPVSDVTRFPAAGVVSIEGEHVRYTSKSGTTGAGNLILGTGGVRGFDDTAPASHPGGAAVTYLAGCATDRGATQAYNVTITIPGYSQGQSFRAIVNLTPDARLAPGSSGVAVSTSIPVSLDVRAPVLKLDMERKDPTGSTSLLKNGVDGEFLFHGTVDDAGSGVRIVQFALQDLTDGKFWDGGRFRDTAEGKPRWLAMDCTKDARADEPSCELVSGKLVWSFPNGRPGDPILEPDDNVSEFKVWARATDFLGNTGTPVTGTPVFDKHPPLLTFDDPAVSNDNPTASLAGRPRVYNGTGLVSQPGKFTPDGATSGNASQPRFFSLAARDGGDQSKDYLKAYVYLLAPNGRLYTHELEPRGASESACLFIDTHVPARDGSGSAKCFSVVLGERDWDEPEQLDWAGEYFYYFLAEDKAGNTWCSFGPCNRTLDREDLSSFFLVDASDPVIERSTLKFFPPNGAPGGVVTASVYIMESDGFAEGYPRAEFLVGGEIVGSGTMRNASEGSVDPVAGFGTWAIDTHEAGVSLTENTTVCLRIHVRDRHDNFTSTAGKLGNNPCPDSFRVLDNAPPYTTLVAPTPPSGGTLWVSASPRLEFRVDDVNLDLDALDMAITPEGGATVRSDDFTTTPIVVGGRIIAHRVVWTGANLTDGKNVTFVFTAVDNLTVLNRTTLQARVDGVLPDVAATVSPSFRASDGRTFVGDATRLRLTGSDAAPGSGLSRLEFRANGGSWSTYVDAVPATGGATWSVEYAAVDAAGNRREGTPLSYTIDREGPVVTVVRSGTNTTITAQDALTRVDDGNVTLYYKTSPTATDYRSFPFDHVTGNTYTANVGALTGNFVFYVEVKDAIGNVGLGKVDGKTCTREAPCGLADSGRPPPTLAITAPLASSTVSGPTEIKWTANAFPGSTPRITVEIADQTRRLLVAQDLRELTGSTTLDPARLGAGSGSWNIVITIDDGVNPPVEVRRTVIIERAPVIGRAETPPPATLAPGQVYETKIPVNNPAKQALTVTATFYLGTTAVKTTTFDVVDGAIEFRFSETTPGVYAARLVVNYADGTSDPPVNAGQFTVAGATTTPTKGPTWQLPTLLVVGALVVALAAVGAFGRWRK